MTRSCIALLGLLLPSSAAAAVPPKPAAVASLYTDFPTTKPVRAIGLAELVHWDPAAGAYALAEEGHPQNWRRSPDGRRMLLLLEYGTTAFVGEPARHLRRGLPFLNYDQRENPAWPAGIAILIVDLDRKTVTAVKLPFKLERVPEDVAWWDDRSILLVGEVTGGVLRNWCLNGCRSEAQYLTRVSLGGGAVQKFEVPIDPLWRLAPEMDFSSTLARSDGLIALSFWLPQVVGGGDGVLFFTETGKTPVRFTRKLDRNDLRQGRLGKNSLRGETWLYRIKTDRRITLPKRERKPPDGRTQVPCGGSNCPPGPAVYWFVSPR
jgi:hypothetical protein